MPVLHNLKVVLLYKIWTFSWISYTILLKSGGTKYHFKLAKIPGTAPYWKAYKRKKYQNKKKQKSKNGPNFLPTISLLREREKNEEKLTCFLQFL